MTRIERVVKCPYCGCASTVALYPTMYGHDYSGDIRLDHDCPACGHRGMDGEQVVMGVLRYEAAAAFARDAARAGLEATFDDLRAVMDIEPMYRTPAGVWYGLRTQRRMDVAPTPAGECDAFDPTYDHYYGQGAEE